MTQILGDAPRETLGRSANEDDIVAAIAARRGRMSLILMVLLLICYFGFLALIVFARPLVATQIRDGITLGIALAVGVILSALVLARVYVAWANGSHDASVRDVS